MKSLTKKVQRFLVSEDGPTAVEYAVMLALIVIVCLTAIQAIGTNASSAFQDIATDIDNAPGRTEKLIRLARELFGEEMVIAIDGKHCRRSHDRETGRLAIDLVSAWATENGVTLGQVKVDDKSNEIVAIPELLEMLEISMKPRRLGEHAHGASARSGVAPPLGGDLFFRDGS